jgi:hypothetical protein
MENIAHSDLTINTVSSAREIVAILALSCAARLGGN